jgi:rhodanese-related sulfurtransferase
LHDRIPRASRRVGPLTRLAGDRIATVGTDRASLDAVCAEELLAKMREEGVVVLDVRPEEEYRAGHIPGARSVPVERLEVYLEELPREREIVAYCRGPYCVFSDEAVVLLQSRGYPARRLREGLPDWRAGCPWRARTGWHAFVASGSRTSPDPTRVSVRPGESRGVLRSHG